MASTVETPEFKRISVHGLHPTFVAEIRGIDFTDVDDETLSEIKEAIHKYGVLVFRNTGLDDAAHVAFSRRLGELDDVRRFLTGGRKLRYAYAELFDAGNLDAENNLLDPDSPRAHANRGNRLFHADSTFNPRRSSYSLLRAVTLPPPNTGGNTDFADLRTAYAALPSSLRDELEREDYIGAHTFAQSRKLGSPEYFADLDPSAFRMARHRLVQSHESGRKTLCVGAHLHHIEGLPKEKSDELHGYLTDFATKEEYVVSIQWEQPGDMIMWDNRCTLHRAAGGAFEGVYKRDLRRTTVHDDGEGAWGLNVMGESFGGFAVDMRSAGEKGEVPAKETA